MNKRGQRDGDDSHHRQPVGRIKHESERGDAGKQRRRRHQLRLTAENEAHELDKNDAETERHQKLIFMRPAVEMPDDDALHHDADDRHKQRPGDDGDDERSGIAVGDIAGVTAEHEHRTMREVQNAERAVDDGQARRDQRQQSAERQPVEQLRYEISPVDHGCVARTRGSVEISCDSPTTQTPRAGILRPRRRGQPSISGVVAEVDSRTRPASASGPCRARFRRCRSSLPCPSCPSACLPLTMITGRTHW